MHVRTPVREPEYQSGPPALNDERSGARLERTSPSAGGHHALLDTPVP